MPAKRIFNVKDFLALLHTPLSTGDIARRIHCNRGTALKYLKELKAKKQIMETRVSNTLNVWKLTLFGNPIMIGDCAQTLKQLPDESIDLIVCDPLYGYRFMNLDWDKALPSLESLKECCRVLKAGAFAMFMCTPSTNDVKSYDNKTW
jgi:predicted methyltransferase